MQTIPPAPAAINTPDTTKRLLELKDIAIQDLEEERLSRRYKVGRLRSEASALQAELKRARAERDDLVRFVKR